MLNKIIRVFGLLLIIGFCSVCIFVFQIERDLQNIYADKPQLQKLISFPSHFEDRFYDFRMSKTLDPTYQDERLVLVAVDDKAIKNIGRWPFKRMTWVPFMQKLSAFGAKLVAYDVILSEKEESCNAASPDLAMAQSFADFKAIPGNEVILPYSIQTYPDEDETYTVDTLPGELYNFIMDSEQDGPEGLEPKWISNATFPIEELLTADPGLSYIAAYEDRDGIFRRYPLVTHSYDIYFPSYSLMAYEAISGDKSKLLINSSGDATLKIKTGELALNNRGEAKIRWVGGANAFPTISMWDVLTADENDGQMRKLLEGKAVFIGSTAFAAHDIRHTPVDPTLAGVYYHMNMVNMLLDGHFFKNKDDSLIWSWGFLIIGTLLLIGIQFYKNAVFDIVFVIIFCGGAYLLDTYYLLPKGYQITLFFSLLSVVGTYSWNTFLNFYMSNKDKQFLKNAFGSYISPELIDMMYAEGKAPELGGKTGDVTAFFTDIQGFSTFSEKLSAAKLVELLNEYLTVMTDILLNEGGTLDKYEGDAIIAFFGAPVEFPDHATRAARVAIKMQKALLVLREKWLSEGDKWPQIVHEMRMRIGINAGEIVTGNMGSASRMNYTMMGDAVNLAARLEESAKQYGIFTHVSKAFLDRCEDIFLFREIDTVKVVGKSEATNTFELIDLKDEAPPFVQELVNKFHEALALYKQQEWEQALSLFKISLELEYQRFPEFKGVKTNPSEIYINRCQQYIKEPPSQPWDGVYTLTSK